jgi:tetraacyldisaccharide 4'-kinase
VISVGNIAAGGSGKTPLVGHLVQVLQDLGERPAILTRGYARQRPSDGVTVVSDGTRMLADLDRAGDEPLVLARRHPTVPVLVSADRFLAGLIAERRLGCSVHVLDDGFQHFQLERAVDLVLLSAADVEDPVTLPRGHLREPLDAAAAATALIVPDADQAQAAAIGLAARVPAVFRLRRGLDLARLVEPAGRVTAPAAGTRVLAVAGLARPEQFFGALEAGGWSIADTLAFADHHPYAAADLDRIVDAMRVARAVMVVTTEKDLVRFLPLRPLPIPVAWVPLRVRVEPAAEFKVWLRGRLALAAADRRPSS